VLRWPADANDGTSIAFIQHFSTNADDRTTALDGGWYVHLSAIFRPPSSVLIGRQIRKMVHNLLNQNIANRYVPYQMLENKQMLNDFLNTPDDFLKHIRRYSNALTTSMVFGWRTSTYEDPKIQQLFDGFTEFSQINQTGTAALIDFFPLLRKLPDYIITTQKRAKKLHAEERKLYLEHWMRAKSEIKDGSIMPCFCVGMAEAQQKDGFSDAQAVGNSRTAIVEDYAKFAMIGVHFRHTSRGWL